MNATHQSGMYPVNRNQRRINGQSYDDNGDMPHSEYDDELD